MQLKCKGNRLILTLHFSLSGPTVFQRGGVPSQQLSDSLLYKLHSNGLVPGVEADSNRWREVFRSKYGKVRIYKILSVSKESKVWVKNNRVCDAPGSWYCPGQYPPALQTILAEKRDFAQLEDFNRGNTDEEYQKQYFENLQ
jgi:dolichyl-diphosphooligosaccharide--protein glycosyltransferase